jgi:tetratricopeptide (TPR) repeat protein
LNDTPAARRAFLKATELNDKFAGAQRNLARILLSEHNYQEVAALLNRSLESEPMNAWALTSAANAELILHKYSDAITHARKAHSVPHQGLGGVHIVAALALEATQQPLDALKEYQLYLDEEPNGRDAARAKAAIARLGADATPPK